MGGNDEDKTFENCSIYTGMNLVNKAPDPQLAYPCYSETMRKLCLDSLMKAGKKMGGFPTMNKVESKANVEGFKDGTNTLFQRLFRRSGEPC